MYKNIDDFKKALKAIEEKCFIKSLRSSDTGIGYTLEECLGIKENNIPLADSGNGIELIAFKKVPFIGSCKISNFSEKFG
jgi:hypothetical protein